MRQAVAEGGTLNGLHARAPVAGREEIGDPNGWCALPAYSKEEFHECLVVFIVADDQVCSEFFNVKLLLIRTVNQCCRT